MEILKRYKEKDAEWESVALEDAIEELEGRGYWKNGTVEEMLEKDLEVWSPFADYRKK